MSDGKLLVFFVTDDQEKWLFDDLESALEHIRAGVEDQVSAPVDGDTFTLEVKYMTREELKALPEV